MDNGVANASVDIETSEDLSIWTTGGTASATVTIEPPLREALANNSSVTYNSVPFTVHLTSDVQEFNSSNSHKDGELLYNYQFDVIESL